MYLAPYQLIQSMLFVVVWVLFKGNLALFQKSRTCRLKKKRSTQNQKGSLLWPVITRRLLFAIWVLLFGQLSASRGGWGGAEQLG